MNRRFLFAGLLTAIVTTLMTLGGASLSVGLTGCGEARFPVCHTDADCQQRDAGKGAAVCVDLRCVECHYDADCAPGSVCGRSGTCSVLDARPREDEDGADAGAPASDPRSWNDCAAACKEQACLSACDRRFKTK